MEYMKLSETEIKVVETKSEVVEHTYTAVTTVVKDIIQSGIIAFPR